MLHTYAVHINSEPYYAGTLSKSLGQILRVSAAMHVLFHLPNEPSTGDTDEQPPQPCDELPSEISNQAITAAIDFVEVCCQHTAYITGHGDISQELEQLESGKVIQLLHDIMHLEM